MSRLLGYATSELDDLGIRDDDFGSLMNAETAELARAALGEEAYRAAYASGREGAIEAAPA